MRRILLLSTCWATGLWFGAFTVVMGIRGVRYLIQMYPDWMSSIGFYGGWSLGFLGTVGLLSLFRWLSENNG